MLKSNSVARPEKMDPSKVIGFEGPLLTSQFSSKDAILYALSIGYSKDPLNAKELGFTYELDDDFRVVPSAATVMTGLDLFEMITLCPDFPEFDPIKILHGEQRVDLLKPLKDNVTYYSRTRIEDVQDKIKGALLVLKVTSSLNQDLSDPTCVQYFALFIRGIGGYETEKKNYTNLFASPKLSGGPVKVLRQKTDPSQALLYRLNGDNNPLHADPMIGEAAGFDRPILHGLCTYGIVTKNIIEFFCNHNVKVVAKIVGRFVGHVFPGETIVISAELVGDKVVFSATTEERGKEVIQGFIQLAPPEQPKL